MMILLQFVLIFFIFFIVKWLAWKITEEWGLPIWLRYKPWECNLCLTFWSLITIYTAIGLSFSCLYVMVGGIVLAIMNALAMWISQRDKTIKI